MFKKFKTNITLQIMSGVVLVFLIVTGIVSAIGYQNFTGAIEKQYAESAFNTARTAAIDLTPRFLKLREKNYEMLPYEVRQWKMQYENIKRNWHKLVDTQNATFIYLFTAEGQEYSDVTFLVNIVNSSTRFEEYESGFKITQTDRRYLNAFKDIYEGKKERVEIAIYRPEEEYVSGNHVTVMIPVYDHFKKIIGILGVERRMEELDNAKANYLIHLAGFSAIFLILVILVYGSYLNRRLLSPIQKIAAEALRFARENTKPEIQLRKKIKNIDEVGQLAETIDVMENDIINYVDNLTLVTKEKEQIKAELNVATQIQASMLPRTFPPFPDRKEFDIYASMTPAKEVGGDFYDFFLIDENHLALVIADVSGKGVPASLFMAISKTSIKNRAQMGGTPSEILFDVNKSLCETNEGDLFVTVWLGILEISTGKIIASNAGHEYPAIKRANGSYELHKSKHSPAVAAMDGMKFKEYEFELNPGDIIYLYTDGVAEATNSDDKLFGTDRMIDVLNKLPGNSAEEILTDMKKAVDDFTGNAPQFDDITMICLRYFGGEKILKELIVKAEVENLDDVTRFIETQLEENDCSPKIQMQLSVAVEELFVNIAHYAYGSEEGYATIQTKILENPRRISITFIDSGLPYNPLEKPDPDITLSAEDRPIGGLGIYMVKKTVNDIFYEYTDGKNILTIIKNF